MQTPDHPRLPSKKTTDVRCCFCDTLLARREEQGLRIMRGDLQAMVMGDFTAAIVCHRPRCGTLNLVRVHTTIPA